MVFNAFECEDKPSLMKSIYIEYRFYKINLAIIFIIRSTQKIILTTKAYTATRHDLLAQNLPTEGLKNLHNIFYPQIHPKDENTRIWIYENITF